MAGGENMDSNKPWLNEVIPELTRKSANDICFKVINYFFWDQKLIISLRLMEDYVLLLLVKVIQIRVC